MIRKCSALIILIITLCILTACNNERENSSDNIVSPTVLGGEPELTILVNSSEYLNIKAEPILLDYIQNFEHQMGVKIKFDILDGYGKFLDNKENDEYMKKFAAKLYIKSGPDLIFTEYFFFHEVIKQNVAEEVSNKIPNINKIYPGLLKDKIYYVPIGMKYYCNGLNSKVLQDIQIPVPEFNWTNLEYFSIWDKWISSVSLYFNAAEYYPVYDRYVQSQLDFEIDNEKLIINIPQAIEGINQARQKIFNNYKIKEGYKYENFFNMIFEENSEEALASQQRQNENRASHINRFYIGNAFRAEEIAKKSVSNTAIVLPEFSDKRPFINTMGFVVNRNSKHLELAYEFINGLLSDEKQMALFNEGDFHYYPVNKDIKEEIKKIEAQNVKEPNIIKLKEHVLQQLDNGVCDTDIDINQESLSIKNMLYKDLSKYILADKAYSAEELNKELNEIVEKYNIWLSE